MGMKQRSVAFGSLFLLLFIIILCICEKYYHFSYSLVKNDTAVRTIYMYY